jgi:hypothetical protein
MRVLCTLLLVAATSYSWAAETNILFLTDDGLLRVNHARKVQEAQKSRESLPSDQFPEGNWGPVTNGFQLSLRLEKTSFAKGEPIPTLLLLHNASTNVLKYARVSVAGQDGPIGFMVSGPSGIIRPAPTDGIDVVSSSEASLAPRTQRKFVERLDRRFDLQSPGTYTVYARFPVDGPSSAEVRSAKVSFERKD